MPVSKPKLSSGCHNHVTSLWQPCNNLAKVVLRLPVSNPKLSSGCHNLITSLWQPFQGCPKVVTRAWPKVVATPQGGDSSKSNVVAIWSMSMEVAMKFPEENKTIVILPFWLAVNTFSHNLFFSQSSEINNMQVLPSSQKHAQQYATIFAKHTNFNNFCWFEFLLFCNLVLEWKKSFNHGQVADQNPL